MKRVAISALVGAVVLSVVSTWLGPKMIGWYVTPADQPAALSCQAAVVGAMHRLVQTQLIGTLIGACIGLVVGILLLRRKTHAATPPAGPAAGAAKP